MNHVSAVSIALLFSSMTITAQSLSRQHASINGVPIDSGCPIGILVEHGMSEQMLRANDGQPKQFAQQLHVMMSNSGSVDIVGAQLTVHGFAAEIRYLPAQSPRTGSPELIKTVDLKVKVKSKGDASSDVRLPNFAAVTLIDLDSVTYADGSTWNSSAGKTCHASPGLMLVSR